MAVVERVTVGVRLLSLVVLHLHPALILVGVDEIVNGLSVDVQWRCFASELAFGLARLQLSAG